ncbi:MAG: hypothetical protein AVDCRST_MAG27-284, partial [uncultured Craurococcus sp.]
AQDPDRPDARLRRCRRCRAGSGPVHHPRRAADADRAARPAREHDGRAHRARSHDQPGRRRPHGDLRHGARAAGVEARAAVRERQRHARSDLRPGDAEPDGAGQRRHPAPRARRRRHVQRRIRQPSL